MDTFNTLVIRELGIQPYEPVWQAMQHFTNTRDEHSSDEIWLLQHEPVFTQGKAGKEEHLLQPKDIPVVYSDRGGQVTYHGPGQLICYILIDVKRHQLGVRALVSAIEDTIIDLLASYSVQAYAKLDAPGVYVNDTKIASLGLGIRRHASFHGFALNIQMNLEPFLQINPCGYINMKMSQLSDYIGNVDFQELTKRVVEQLMTKLCYSQVVFLSGKDMGL